MTQFLEIKKRWLKDPEVCAEYDALEEEFALAREFIVARARAGLSQAQVAQRMGTTQSTVARLEGGNAKPTLLTVERYAKATGCRAVVKLGRDRDAA